MTIRTAGNSGRLAGFIPYALLALVTFALYANTLAGGFVWDDNLFTANQVYWRFDLRTILLSLANGLEYQPVRDLTFLADIALWGDRPFGFHLTNLLLFMATVLLVYRVAAALSARFVRAEEGWPAGLVPLLTALLFAVHPLRCEVVAWVTQRNTLLATFFFLLALLWFLRYQEKKAAKFLLLASGAFLLALLAKATVVVLPLLLLLLMMPAGGSDRWPSGRGWLPLLPFVLLAGAGAALHLTIARQTAVISAAYYGSLAERVAVALQVPFFYLQKTLLPRELTAFYAENFATVITAPQTVAAALVLAAAAAAAWLLRRRLPELLLGGGWFIITLLPVSNLFATSPVVADRYIYLPSVGLAFLAAVLCYRLCRRFKAAVVVGVLLVPLALLTQNRNRVWHDDITLWSDSAARTPQVAGVWFNLGRAWHRTPRLGLALEAYLRAVSLDPADLKALDNAATLFPSTRGSLAERRELVRELAAKLPPQPAGLALLGYTPAGWQHPDAAEELFLNLLAVDTGSVALQLALANLYREVEAYDRAMAIYGDVVKSGQGRGEAEFGLAAIAAADGNRQEMARLLALARSKGGVPENLLRSIQ